MTDEELMSEQSYQIGSTIHYIGSALEYLEAKFMTASGHSQIEAYKGELMACYSKLATMLET